MVGRWDAQFVLLKEFPTNHTRTHISLLRTYGETYVVCDTTRDGNLIEWINSVSGYFVYDNNRVKISVLLTSSLFSSLLVGFQCIDDSRPCRSLGSGQTRESRVSKMWMMDHNRVRLGTPLIRGPFDKGSQRVGWTSLPSDLGSRLTVEVSGRDPGACSNLDCCVLRR